MSEHKLEVKDFFNQISDTYRDKYTPQQAFHHYFFVERLEEAVKGLDLSGKSVCDVGAGTGNLYDFLMERYTGIQYNACDIAEQMLAQSNIPPANYQVGACYETQFSQTNFDFIFLLGVTTYLNPEQMEKTLEWIWEKLTPNTGRAILTFTNKHTLDQGLRKTLKAPLKIFAPNKTVLTALDIFPYSPSQATELVNSQFRIEQVTYLNQTVFPFNRLFPKSSISLAKRFKKSVPNGTVKSLLSSDFIFFLSKKPVL